MFNLAHWTCRWPVKKQRSWQGRMGCATWRRRPAMPSTWSTPSPSWPETSSPWCVLVISPSRKAGKAWRAGLSPTWFTLPRKWRRVTVAAYADLAKGIVTEGAKEMDAEGTSRRNDGLSYRPSRWIGTVGNLLWFGCQTSYYQLKQMSLTESRGYFGSGYVAKNWFHYFHFHGEDRFQRLVILHGLPWLNFKSDVGLVFRLLEHEVPSWKSSEGLRIGDPIWFFTKISKLLSSFYQHLYLYLLLFYFITLSSSSICNDMITYGKIYVQQPSSTLYPFRKKERSPLIVHNSSAVFCFGIFLSGGILLLVPLSQLNRGVLESQWENMFSAPGGFQACEAIKASSELNDIENITTTVILLEHQDKPLAPLWQTLEKRMCTTETTTMDLQDDLSTPTNLPFYWWAVQWTSETVGSREHLNWPSTPWLWSTDEWLSLMTKMRTVPFFKARQTPNLSGDSAAEP